jgi:hypothetical protein
MKKYIITNSNWILTENGPREVAYIATSRNAMKAADEYGNGDDPVTVYTANGKPVSRAAWDIERRKYIRVAVSDNPAARLDMDGIKIVNK